MDHGRVEKSTLISAAAPLALYFGYAYQRLVEISVMIIVAIV